MKLGILGLGIRSTHFYTHLLHKRIKEMYGNYHTFPFLMYQVDFNLINPLLPNNINELKPVLNNINKELVKFKMDNWLIPNITLHETLDQIELNYAIYHPITLLLNYCKSNDVKQIIVLGTNYTMNSNYISNCLKDTPIVIAKISKEEQNLVDNLRSNVYNKKESKLEIESYKRLISKYSKKSYIIIACTELSLLTSQVQSNKIIDLALLQINQVFLDYINKK